MCRRSAFLLLLTAVSHVAVRGAKLKYEEALELMIQDQANLDVLSAFRTENKEVSYFLDHESLYDAY